MTGNRSIILKRIVDPNDPDPKNPTNYIDVPIIALFTIVDSTGYRINRSYVNDYTNTVRKVRSVTVKNKTTPDGSSITTDDSNSIDVARTIQCDHVYKSTRQNHFHANSDPAPLPSPLDPDYDPTRGHMHSHVVRYNKDNVNDPNATPWVDIELTDGLSLVGQFPGHELSGAAQRLNFWLNQDPGDKTFFDQNDPFNPTWADTNFYQTQNWTLLGNMDADIDNDGNVRPVMLDPFSNIVNIDWGGLAVEFFDGAT